MDLLSVLPYNREVVHTSVLSYLLSLHQMGSRR